MTRPIHKLSSIARPLEPQYRTNLIMLILLPLIGIAGGAAAHLLHDQSLLSAAGAGLSTLLVAFLSWALGREIDPDRNITAFLAMPLALIPVFAGLDSAVWTLALALMATRIVNRTVGLTPRLADLFLVLGLAAASVFLDGYWAMGLAAAIAYCLDTIFDRGRGLNLVFAFFAVGLSVFAMLNGNLHEGPDFNALIIDPLLALDRGLAIAAGLIALLFLGAIITYPPVASVCDTSSVPLLRGRVCGGCLVVLAVAIATLLSGPDGVIAALPLWAVLVAGIVRRVLPRWLG